MVSNGSKPLVGLTTYIERARFGVWETDSAVLHRVYVDGIVRAARKLMATGGSKKGWSASR